THKTLRGPRAGMIMCRQQYAKDLDRAVFPGVQGGPLMHIIAAKAVCFKEAMDPSFADYQRQIAANAARLANALSGHGFRLVSGGTDNHLMLVDVFSKGITGKVAEAALGKAGITVNKNAIPFDQNPPMVASGIRVGTPAITSRGMREPEMDIVADLIARALSTPDDDAALAAVKSEVEALCRKFPLYPEARSCARRSRPGSAAARPARRPAPFTSRRSTPGLAKPRPAIAPRSRTCPRICRSGLTSPRPPRTASGPTAPAIRTALSFGCGSAPRS